MFSLFPRLSGLVSLLAGNVSASYPSTVRPEDVSGMKLRVCETQVWGEGQEVLCFQTCSYSFFVLLLKALTASSIDP